MGWEAGARAHLALRSTRGGAPGRAGVWGEALGGGGHKAHGPSTRRASPSASAPDGRRRDGDKDAATMGVACALLAPTRPALNIRNGPLGRSHSAHGLAEALPERAVGRTRAPRHRFTAFSTDYRAKCAVPPSTRRPRGALLCAPRRTSRRSATLAAPGTHGRTSSRRARGLRLAKLRFRPEFAREM